MSNTNSYSITMTLYCASHWVSVWLSVSLWVWLWVWVSLWLSVSKYDWWMAWQGGKWMQMLKDIFIFILT